MVMIDRRKAVVAYFKLREYSRTCVTYWGKPWERQVILSKDLYSNPGAVRIYPRRPLLFLSQNTSSEIWRLFLPPRKHRAGSRGVDIHIRQFLVLISARGLCILDDMAGHAVRMGEMKNVQIYKPSVRKLEEKSR